MTDPTPGQQRQEGRTDEELSAVMEADPNIAQAMRLISESGIDPQSWCEEEGIDLDALKAFASVCQRRVEGNDTLTAFGAACYAFQVGLIAGKYARKRWTDFNEQVADLVSEYRAGSIDKATLFDLIDQAHPKIKAPDAD